ncbi:MAG: homogentisate 1,2-dioxygenase [Bdellovibrionota bacterium]|nr:MAG: homogentisate 1,2-dioxygenase [Bdellovibrionota bacterium]
MGTEGFSGAQSLLYHHWDPTRLKSSELVRRQPVELLEDDRLEPRHLSSAHFQSSGDPITSRVVLFANAQVNLGLATPNAPMDYFYRNGMADEVIFVHAGGGIVRSVFGNLPFRQGDYIIIPVGTTYQMRCEKDCRLLVVESGGRIQIPRRYRNEFGQLLEHCPYSERDFRLPEKLECIDEMGDFPVIVKMGDALHRVVMDHHPFDVVGWDGRLYPWIFNIGDFEPITGRVHLPPPTHQTFAGDGFVICSFVPRMYDYHPEAVPVPYNHSNVNSDEVLYYVDGDFMSRKGIQTGSFTLHPAGVPHGPHPGTVEASLGKRETRELAVMLDTFLPLRLTKQAAPYLDPSYVRSWIG